MRFLWLSFLAGSLGLYATPVGTTFSSVTCVYNSQTVSSTSSCNIPVAGDFPVSASAAANSWNVSVSASGPLSFSNWRATASAGESGIYAAAGPVQNGFVAFDVFFGVHDWPLSGNPDATLSDGTHRYVFSNAGAPVPFSHCNIGACEWIGMLPFTFGAGRTFTASLTDSVSAAVSCGAAGSCEPDNLTFDFSLLESDGKTPVPFTAVPEPSCVLLLGTGIAVLAAGRKRPRA